jgi:hypothetical protein
VFFYCIVGIVISLFTVAACADKRRKRPLFIVQGLMCCDSLCLFLLFCCFGVWPLDARFRLVLTGVGLVFFVALSDVSNVRVLFLVGDDKQSLSGVAWGSGHPAHSTLVLCCIVVSAVGYVTRGKE